MADNSKRLKNRIKKIKKASIFGEFKKFVLRGNVIDLAVGVIIGGAFNKIVTSLVNDIIMPLLSVVIGQTQFNNLFIALDGGKYTSIEEAGTVPLLRYGNFITTVLDFLIMAFVIFLLVKGINVLHDKLKKDEAAPAPEPPKTKSCQYCCKEMDIGAVKCPYCTSEVDGKYEVYSEIST